jgi:hypothetical protein
MKQLDTKNTALFLSNIISRSTLLVYKVNILREGHILLAKGDVLFVLKFLLPFHKNTV